MLSKLPCLLRSALVCTLSLLATVSLAQTTRNVGPGQPYSTIQSGINAAANGDTVLVAPGTYYENINFNGKAITVTSSGGAAVTTISGPNKTAAVAFLSGEARSSVLSNFTITAGGQYYLNLMGGIYVSGSSPTILNNIITNTTCYGILSTESSPLIQGNEISYVQAQPYECTFASGAGIWLYDQKSGINPLVVGNTIENNTQSGLEDAGGNGGAGIAVWRGSPIIANNIIRNNATGKYFSPAGGGEGGGIYFEIAGGLVINNLIYGNTSNIGGGGIYVFGANGGGAFSLALINNTIVDNAVVPVNTYSQAVVGGEQIYYEGGNNSAYTLDLSLSNNIINGSTTGPSVVCYDGSINPVTYSHNDFYNAVGPVTGVYGSGTCTFPSGNNGNISVDPAFVSESSQNYHLLLSSSDVDTGDNSAIQTAVALGFPDATDLDGKPREQDATGKGCIIDMGAYEYPGTVSICGTAETLTSSVNPAVAGQSVTFTAQLSSSTGVPTGDIQFLDGATVLFTQAVSGTGSAAFSTSSLAIGSHTITANYQPTGSFGATSASLTQVINGYTTATTLTCSPSSISVLNTALLTAAVTSASGTPTGSVAFTDNGASLATQALLNGATSLTYTGSTAATHTITATYTPTGSFASSSATCSEVVSALPTTSVLTITPSTSTYGSTVTLSAAVSPSTPPGHGTPAGSVTFYDGTTSLAVVALDASGDASFSSSLAIGTHTLTAVYAGNTTYSASTSAIASETIVAIPTTTTLSVSPNPAQAFQFFTVTAQVTSSTSTTLSVQPCFPTCTVTFTITGLPPGVPSTATAPVLVNGTASAKYAFAVGTYTFSAAFNGSTNFSASTATPIQQTVIPAATTLALTGSPNPAGQNQIVNLAGTLTAPVSSESPSGTMTYLDGTTPIGTAPFTGSALANSTSATLPISTLAPGTHTITVSYAGNANFLASTSAPITLTIVPQDFTITLASPTVTI
jgi:parallel beta-helix repeat protein